MWTRIATVTVIALTWFSALYAQEFIPDSDESREYLSSLAQIESEYPPHSHVVLGLGRSPWIWIEGLRMRHPNAGSAFHLPLSGFRHTPGEGAMTAEMEQLLFLYFDEVIPSADVVGRRKIVVLDYTVKKGASVLSAATFLRRYLQQRGRRTEVIAAALSDQLQIRSLDRNFYLPESEEGIRYRLLRQAYDGYAPHRSRNIDDIRSYFEANIDFLAPSPEALAQYRLLLDRIHQVMRTGSFPPATPARTAQEIAQDLNPIYKRWRNIGQLRSLEVMELLIESRLSLPHEIHMGLAAGAIESAHPSTVDQILAELIKQARPSDFSLLRQTLSRMGNRKPPFMFRISTALFELARGSRAGDELVREISKGRLATNLGIRTAAAEVAKSRCRRPFLQETQTILRNALRSD
jgi:hypothetical protein